jgi:hypothetical protein
MMDRLTHPWDSWIEELGIPPTILSSLFMLKIINKKWRRIY